MVSFSKLPQTKRHKTTEAANELMIDLTCGSKFNVE